MPKPKKLNFCFERGDLFAILPAGVPEGDYEDAKEYIEETAVYKKLSEMEPYELYCAQKYAEFMRLEWDVDIERIEEELRARVKSDTGAEEGAP